MFVCASTKSGIASVKDLVARAQAAPGTLNYGSSGVGSPHHLTMERFLKEMSVTDPQPVQRLTVSISTVPQETTVVVLEPRPRT